MLKPSLLPLQCPLCPITLLLHHSDHSHSNSPCSPDPTPTQPSDLNKWDGYWPQWVETIPLTPWTIWQDISSPVLRGQKHDQCRLHLHSQAQSPFGSIRSPFEVGLNKCKWVSNTDKWRRNSNSPGYFYTLAKWSTKNHNIIAVELHPDSISEEVAYCKRILRHC